VIGVAMHPAKVKVADKRLEEMVYDTARARKPPCGRAAPRPFPALEERAESPAERRAAV